MSNTFYILVGLFFFFLVCYLLLKAFVDRQNKKQAAKSQLTDEQRHWLQTVGRLFRENYVMGLLDVYEQCGMPSEIAQSRDSELISQNIPFEKDSGGYNVLLTYSSAISQRHSLVYLPLDEIPADRYGLTLKQNEHIYHRINFVNIFQEKTTQMNFVYSGIRWQSGMLRAGSMNVIGNEITRFVQLDAGRLIFTNKRIIYIGAQRNVTKDIKIDDILYTTVYQDGVMVHQANKKPLLFKFSEEKDFEACTIGDGLFEFMTVLGRIKAGTETQNLLQNNNSISSISEILTSKGYDALVYDVFTSFSLEDEFGTTMVQRKFNIGYNRAESIIDQLKSLGLIISLDNGKNKIAPIIPENAEQIIRESKEYNPEG